MANHADNLGGRRGMPWRLISWSIPVFLLLLPLVAMRFTEEVNWTAFDFVFAAVLFGSVGLAFEFIVRRSGSFAYRAGAALAVFAAFLTIWANGAVGMIGSEDNPYNLLFGAVILIGIGGAIVARFRAMGMARAMAIAAVAQAALGIGGMSADLRGGILSAMFAGLWAISAGLLWSVAQDERQAADGARG